MPASCPTGVPSTPTTPEADHVRDRRPTCPPPLPDHHAVVEGEVTAARPARGFDATTVILPGQTPGTTTYRLRGTETSAGDGRSG